MVEAVNEFIAVHAAASWLLPLLFVFFAVDGVLPPLPSEGVLVSLAAIGAATGTPHWFALFLAAAAGAWVGDNTAYVIGRRGRLDRLVGRSARGQRALAWASRHLERRGALIVLVGRWIPVGRAAVNLTAGATAYPQRRFAAFTVLSGSLWAAWSVGIGTLAGHWIQDNPLLGAVVAIAVAVVVGLGLERASRLLTRDVKIG